MGNGQREVNSAGLARDIRLLELLASDGASRAGGYGVTDLARLTGRSKSVVSRAMATLVEAGLAAREADRMTFRVGPRWFALAARTAESRLVKSAQPVLRGLVRGSQETAHLCVLSHGNVLTLASQLSPHELRSAGWEGVTTAAWRTPSGRVLLSDWDQDSLKAWYDEHGHDDAIISADTFEREANPFPLLSQPPGTRTRLTDFEGFRTEVARVRSCGYAVVDEELEQGVVGTSAPVIDHTGRVIAALNVSGPKSRLAARSEATVSLVREAAVALSRNLGGYT